MPHQPVRVVGAAEASARDRDAIDAGIPSRALMQRAGAAAAAEIALRHPERLAAGVVVCAGPGNNGGDGWVVARALASSGVRVTVVEPLPARTADCSAERALALPDVTLADAVPADASLVVDALLGTGSSGDPRGAIADSVGAVARARSRGAAVVALDLPTGVDAEGAVADAHVPATLTLSFGTLKRGHLAARAACGRVVVLDIGLGAFAHRHDGAAFAVDERWVADRLPRIPHDAHKGTRGRLVVLGGARGMAGAAVLAARGALRSGVGMVRVLADADTTDAIVRAEPAALGGPWPADDAAMERDVLQWADAVAIGPGLGRGDESRALVERVLRAFRGPVLLDADALNVFAGDIAALRPLLATRPSLLTPHPAELGRLLGVDLDIVTSRRFEIGSDAARTAGATVLLKGVPTVVSDPDGERLVSATGTSALATGGSGDLLTGMAGTLLAQGCGASVAGACAAWVHGRAAEMASHAAGDASPRGVALDDVVAQLPRAWSVRTAPTRYPVLLELDPA